MAAHPRTISVSTDGRANVPTAVYTEGMFAGVVGGATIAAWFLLVDMVAGRPFYTPTVLGDALFRGGRGLDAATGLSPALDVVLPFTWLHLLTFLVIGAMAARLLALAERDPNYGFGILLLFIIFQIGFVFVCMLFAEPVLDALAWPAIVVGNLLAAAAMATVLWRRHPTLRILP